MTFTASFPTMRLRQGSFVVLSSQTAGKVGAAGIQHPPFLTDTFPGYRYIMSTSITGQRHGVCYKLILTSGSHHTTINKFWHLVVTPTRPDAWLHITGQIQKQRNRNRNKDEQFEHFHKYMDFAQNFRYTFPKINKFLSVTDLMDIYI